MGIEKLSELTSNMSMMYITENIKEDKYGISFIYEYFNNCFLFDDINNAYDFYMDKNIGFFDIIILNIKEKEDIKKFINKIKKFFKTQCMIIISNNKNSILDLLTKYHFILEEPIDKEKLIKSILDVCELIKEENSIKEEDMALIEEKDEALDTNKITYPSTKELRDKIKEKNIPLTLSIVKIDAYQNINDYIGQEYGDKLSQEVFKIIKQTTKNYPSCIETYMINKDEIAVLIDDDIIATKDIVEDIYEISKFFHLEYKNIYLSSTFTMVSYYGKNNLFKKAYDCFLTKTQTQKTESYITSEVKEIKKQEDQLIPIKLLCESIKKENIVPYYQPILNNETGKIDKYECLARIIHNGTLYSPNFFISSAYKMNYNSYFIKQMVKKIFTTIKDSDTSISINMTANEIMDETVIAQIEYWRKKYNIAPQRVTFEILEDKDLYEKPEIKKQLDKMRKIGYILAIDDFGTGYSNLIHMVDFEIDIIKIDGSLISKIHINKSNLEVLSKICDIIKLCNAKSVAEFVSNKDIYELVKNAGINYSQGHFIGKPLETIEELSISQE